MYSIVVCMHIPLSQRPVIAAVAPSAGRMPRHHTHVRGERVTSRQAHRQLSRRRPGNAQWLSHHAGDLLYEKRWAVIPHIELKFRLLPLSAATLRAKAALQVTLPCAFADLGRTEDLSKLLSTWLSPAPPQRNELWTSEVCFVAVYGVVLFLTESVDELFSFFSFLEDSLFFPCGFCF